MIQNFGEKETEQIWLGYYSKKLPSKIQHSARRKLRMINSAQNLNDLRVPPGNRLEALKGNLKGYHSIRINEQWRIIFQWIDNDAFEVEIIDYH